MGNAELLIKLIHERDLCENAIDMMTFDCSKDFSDTITQNQIRIEDINIELEELGYDGEDIE